MAKNLNIGSFTVMSKGEHWLNIDIEPLHQLALQTGCNFLQHDVRYNLPFIANDSVDHIFTSHFLEHIPYDLGRRFLRECHRVLRPGGVIRITVPDLASLVADYSRGKMGRHDAINEPASRAVTQAEKLWCLLMENHAAIYDFFQLEHELIRAEFTKISQSDYKKGSQIFIDECQDVYPTVSLYVEATKP